MDTKLITCPCCGSDACSKTTSSDGSDVYLCWTCGMTTTSLMEDGSELSASFERHTLSPDADTSAISDPVVLAQFNAVMTKEVKDNYAKFLKEQAEQNKAS